VEYANVEELFDRPRHPYTQGLFRSMPRLGVKMDRLDTIPGMVTNPTRFPPGCKFHPRCNAVNGDGACSTQQPQLKEVDKGHWAACHHAPGFDAAPITLNVSSNKRIDRAAAIVSAV
jgi:peptide/nickel transport system ATP-binding protein